MTDSGFVKAQSNYLPKIDILFVMSTFFASNPDFTSAEIKEESCKMYHKVFVYGTLKRNEPNHNWLTNPDHGVGKFIGEGATKTKYPLIIATRYNIPFLLYSPGKGHNVKGEIYEVDDLMLSKLDILEDHPNYYVREIDEITLNKMDTSSTSTEKCWVYFLKTFRPDLLNKPQMERYSSAGSHGLPYVESNNESTIEDLNDGFDSVFKKKK